MPTSTIDSERSNPLQVYSNGHRLPIDGLIHTGAVDMQSLFSMFENTLLITRNQILKDLQGIH